MTFWHRSAPPAFSTVLYDFVRLETSPEEWEDPAFDAVLREFRRRFSETETEEGDVMSAVLAYVLQEIPPSRRILATYRNSARARRVFEQRGGPARAGEALDGVEQVPRSHPPQTLNNRLNLMIRARFSGPSMAPSPWA